MKPTDDDMGHSGEFYWLERAGHYLAEGFHYAGLFIIGLAVIWASLLEIFEIVAHGGPSVKDILLLFIYLELGAMIGIYFKTRQLPVRFLLYIAITALTRVLAIDIKEMLNERILAISGAILLIALALLLLRIGSDRFPKGDTV
jgi:protein PsiE